MYSARRNVNKDSTIWRSIISDFHRSRLAKAMLARTYTKGAHRWSASYFLPFDSSHTVQPGKGSNVKLFSLIFEVGLCRAFCERFLAFDVSCCRMHGSINANHRSRFSVPYLHSSRRESLWEKQTQFHPRDGGKGSRKSSSNFVYLCDCLTTRLDAHNFSCSRMHSIFIPSFLDRLFLSFFFRLFFTAETKSRQRTQKL